MKPTLRDEIIHCLEMCTKHKKQLQPIIQALNDTTKSIENNDNLDTFFIKLIMEVPIKPKDAPELHALILLLQKQKVTNKPGYSRRNR